jgi:hypothetical protein
MLIIICLDIKDPSGWLRTVLDPRFQYLEEMDVFLFEGASVMTL